MGRIIATAAGKALKPVLMELGGKASAIVCEDADLEVAGLQCALGAFLHVSLSLPFLPLHPHIFEAYPIEALASEPMLITCLHQSGQVCMSTERILLHTSLTSSFPSALNSAISKLYGPSTPAPILVTPAGVTKSQRLLSQAESKGAKIITGDLNAKETSETRMRPIVVEGVTKEMDLFYEESFGPSVALFTFETEEEALALANDTEYGLSAAVFTRDLARGLRLARQIESGWVIPSVG